MLALALLILNIIDTVSTLYLVRSGYAYEVNPIMAYMLDLGDWYFITAKAGLVIPSVAVLYIYRHLPISRYCSTIAITVYALVISVHLYVLYQVFI